MIIPFVKIFVLIESSPYERVNQNYWLKMRNLGNGYDVSVLRNIHDLYPFISRVNSGQLVTLCNKKKKMSRKS